MLVHERFGYPDFFTKSADELVDAQYKDRAALRLMYDAVLALLSAIGDCTVQTRTTYVSLVTPLRTFAVLAPTTRTRLDLGSAGTTPRPRPAFCLRGAGSAA